MKLIFVRSVLVLAFPFFFWAAVLHEAFRAGYHEALHQGRDFLNIWRDVPSRLKQRNLI